MMSKLKLFSIFGLYFSMQNLHALTQEEIDAAREQLKDIVDHSDVGASYSHMLNFFTEADISSSYFQVDDDANTEFDLYKFPFQKNFSINEEGWEVVVRGTLSYATAAQKAKVFSDEVVNAEWSAYSGNIGSGLIVPINKNLSFIGGLDLGLSRLESDAKYRGDTLDALSPVVDGILYNWETNAWIGSLVMGVDYVKDFEEGYDLEIKGRYTYSYIASFSEPEDLPSFSDSTNTFSLKADFTHPLGISVSNYPLYGVAHFGNTSFVGKNQDILGFSYFFELGYSLKIDLSQKKLPVESLSFGYQWNKGDKVEGHTFLFGWEFAAF
jgi:hypothetical protein